MGFEPTVRSRVQRFSRPPRSTAPASLHAMDRHVRQGVVTRPPVRKRPASIGATGRTAAGRRNPPTTAAPQASLSGATKRTRLSQISSPRSRPRSARRAARAASRSRAFPRDRRRARPPGYLPASRHARSLDARARRLWRRARDAVAIDPADLDAGAKRHERPVPPPPGSRPCSSRRPQQASSAASSGAISIVRAPLAGRTTARSSAAVGARTDDGCARFRRVRSCLRLPCSGQGRRRR